MKNILLSFIFLLSFQNFLNAEIKDARVRQNFYSTCHAEFDPKLGFTKNEHHTYCSCAADEVMKSFTVKELMLLESKMVQQSSEDDQIKVALANKKFEGIIIDCASKILK